MGNTTENKGRFGAIIPEVAEDFDRIAKERYNRNRKHQLTVIIKDWVEKELRKES